MTIKSIYRERTYASKDAPRDEAFVRQLVSRGISYRGAAAIYEQRTGRRICHKTVKRICERGK